MKLGASVAQKAKTLKGLHLCVQRNLGKGPMGAEECEGNLREERFVDLTEFCK